MSDKRTDDEIRADVIVSHFLGTEIVPTIPDAMRLSEQIARALSAVRREELRAAAGTECGTSLVGRAIADRLRDRADELVDP